MKSTFLLIAFLASTNSVIASILNATASTIPSIHEPLSSPFENPDTDLNTDTATSSSLSSTPTKTQLILTTLSTTLRSTSATASQTSLIPLGEGEAWCASDDDCVYYGACTCGGYPECIPWEFICGCPAS